MKMETNLYRMEYLAMAMMLDVLMSLRFLLTSIQQW